MLQLIVSTVLLLTIFPAESQKNSLSAFENLVGKTWQAAGKWGDGSAFKQETSFEYGLNKQIIVAKSSGFVNQEQTEFGERNHGIRKYDSESGKILFWEFDVFGGTTTGEVLLKENKLLYVYEYGGSLLVDVWEQVDDRTYTLKVGAYQDGGLGQIYMDGMVRLKD